MRALAAVELHRLAQLAEVEFSGRLATFFANHHRHLLIIFVTIVALVYRHQIFGTLTDAHIPHRPAQLVLQIHVVSISYRAWRQVLDGLIGAVLVLVCAAVALCETLRID